MDSLNMPTNLLGRLSISVPAVERTVQCRIPMADAINDLKKKKNIFMALGVTR